jgi:hypothetical protein
LNNGHYTVLSKFVIIMKLIVIALSAGFEYRSCR